MRRSECPRAIARRAPTARGFSTGMRAEAACAPTSRAPRVQNSVCVMRHDDEENPKKPQPIAVTKKKTNELEGAEGEPWLIRKDGDRDRHCHVV